MTESGQACSDAQGIDRNHIGCIGNTGLRRLLASFRWLFLEHSPSRKFAEKLTPFAVLKY